ncbi:MAG: DNA polymerase I [Terriglobia bacterium]
MLFDTMSLVFRAFYAPMQAPLISASGMPTQAVYIFVRTLRKLLREANPDYAAAAFDLPAPTFRDKLLQAYKANRQPFPEDLVAQLPYVRRFCHALGVPTVEREGFEADDVIGTLASCSARSGIETVVVSGDEDLFQLVNGSIKVLKPSRQAKDGETLCDEQKVKEIIGVEPSEVVDWIALTGDPSDNIPGARPLPGQEPAAEAGAKRRSYIGPKGATELIQKFKTLEAALDGWQDVSRASYREALRDFRTEALLSRDLARIHCDVPLDVQLSDLKMGCPNLEEIVPLCRELGFTSLLKEFAGEGSQRVEIATVAADELTSAHEVENWLGGLEANASLAISAAFEGQEGFAARLTAVGLADASRRAVIPLAMSAERRELIDSLAPVLSDRGRRKIAHNSKLLCLLFGQELKSIAGIAGDTQIYSYLLDPLGSSDSAAYALLRRTGRQISETPAETAAAAMELDALLAPEIEQKGLGALYREIELPLAAVLADIEAAGVRIDTGILREMSGQFEARLAALTHEIYSLAGQPFEIDSPRQLGEILFDKLKLPGGKKLRKSGQYSTDASVLEGLAERHDLPRRILDYRMRAKLKSTYVDALPRYLNPATSRLHSTFDQTGSRTGRLSSSNPNLQNIPVGDEYGKLIRSAFAPDPGWKLIAADYSQIELRVLAHVSGDPLLVESFSRGEDIHSRTAQELFGVLPALQTHEHRRVAKAINYGVIYGLSSFGLAQRTGSSKTEAQRYIDEYFRRYSRVDEFVRGCIEEARTRGEVRTLFGRLRPIPEIRSGDAAARGRAEREAMNTPLQGTAADLLKLAMVKLHARLKLEGMKTRIILTVHDELVLEAPDAEVESARNLIQTEMEGVHPLRVPVRVDIGVGANWRDAK